MNDLVPNTPKKAGTQMPEWARVLFEEHWRYISVRGGRGSGKTKNFARALILKSVTRKLRVLCTREIQLSIRESVYATLVNEIQEMGLSSEFEILSNEIRSTRHGGTFIFRGLATETIDSIKSLAEIDIAWVEEAQSISMRSLDMLFPTIRATGSQIWFSWNPELETDPIYVKIIKEGLPMCASLFVNFDQNPWFPEVLRLEEQHMKAHDPVKHLHVWGGMPLPAVAGAIYFDEINLMQVTGRLRPLVNDPMLQTYITMDLGYADFMSCGVSQRTTYDIRVLDFIENQRAKLEWYSDEFYNRGYGGATIVLPHDGANKSMQTGLSPQEIMQMYGWNTEICSNVGVENGIRTTRETMGIMYIDPYKCELLLEHLKRYARNKHGYPIHDDHSHASDMTRYLAVHSNVMQSSVQGPGGWGSISGGQLNYPKIVTG